MRKKILALLLVIPLIFMFTIFSASSVVSLIVPVPVNEISIKNASQNGVVYFDMATYKNDFKLQVEITPVQASNKKYVVTCEPSNIVYFENDILKLKQAGSVKITAKSKDGNFVDSLTVVVYSSFATSIGMELVSNDVNLTKVENKDYDYIVDLKSGNYALNAYALPKGVVADIMWASDNKNVLEIDSVGRFVAMLTGSAIVTALADGVNGEICSRVKVNVSHNQNQSGLYLFSPNITNRDSDGVDTKVFCENESFMMKLEADTEIQPVLEIDNMSADKKYFDGEPIVKLNSSAKPANENFFEVTFKLKKGLIDSDKKLMLSVKVYDKNTIKKPRLSINVAIEKFAVNILTSNQTENSASLNQLKGMKQTYFALGNLFGENLTYKWSVEDSQKISIVHTSKNSVNVLAKEFGKTNLILSVYLNQVELVNLTQEINVTDNLIDIQFVDKVGKDGISGLLCLGDTKLVDGNYVNFSSILNLQSLRQGEASTGGLNDIIVESSDESIAKAKFENGKVSLDIFNTGIVTIKAKWLHNDKYGKDIKTAIRVRCVKGGVEVNNYSQLLKSTTENKQIVLTSSIMLGEQGLTAEQIKSKGYVRQMQTTANCAYINNINAKSETITKFPTTVLYAIKFSNNVYGNGYQLNAEYIANCKDKTGNNRLYNGPLNLVNLMGAASVKAQDNIAFLVDGDQITIDNVTLKNCLDSSIQNNGNVDLTLLDCVGTTLEVMSSARVINSRLLNGRTVLRVFGGNREGLNAVVNRVNDVDVANERIKVSVESCILGYAREFIVKVGANKILKAINGNFEPKLFSEYNKPTTEKEFYDRFVLTDLTLKNCVLYNSGLFAIGVESNFSGELLTGHIDNFAKKVNDAIGSKDFIEQLIGQMKDDWKNIGGTSFASVVNLVGDTRLHNWKPLEDINSSSLIDVGSNNEMLDNMLTLDIATMVSELSNKPQFANIITTFENEKYAHCGVMFYGGGRNYSKLDATLLNEKAQTEYKINLSLLSEGRTMKDANGNWDFLFLQGEYMPYAAGRQDFKFFMYSASDFDDTYFNQSFDISEAL